MKRSEKLFMRSRHSGWMAAISLMASVAIVCWIPAAGLSDEPHPGGMVLVVAAGVLALTGFCLAWHLAAEALRLSRLGYTETRWEWEREIRPKI